MARCFDRTQSMPAPLSASYGRVWLRCCLLIASFTALQPHVLRAAHSQALPSVQPPMTEAPAVDIAFGATRYRVPRRYLSSFNIAPYSGNGAAGFSIEALLPTLEGKSSSNISRFVREDSQGRHIGQVADILRASIDYEPAISDSLDEQRKIHTAHSAVIFEAFHDSDPHFQDMGNGIRLYVPPSSTGNAMVENYFKILPNGDTFIFQCNTTRLAPFPSCSVAENWPDHVVVSYYFDRKYVTEAYSIDENLRSLVNSFKLQSQ